jgi:hypothetical protein
VIFAGYSASLISNLAVQPRVLPFRDLQGLLSDGSYRLGVLQNAAATNIFDVIPCFYTSMTSSNEGNIVLFPEKLNFPEL